MAILVPRLHVAAEIAIYVAVIYVFVLFYHYITVPTHLRRRITKSNSIKNFGKLSRDYSTTLLFNRTKFNFSLVIYYVLNQRKKRDTKSANAYTDNIFFHFSNHSRFRNDRFDVKKKAENLIKQINKLIKMHFAFMHLSL